MRDIRPDRVAIYVRWSTDDQSEGTTLQTQLEGCRHYALSQGWAPCDDLTFIDDGYSGATVDRPALQRLRKAVQAGEIDCVVVFKVDRLSRNIVDAVDLVLGEWRESCYFKSAREPIDTGSDLGRVVFSILAMFADFERSQIRERTQSGKIRRIAEGKQLHGSPAFGYRPSGVAGQWAEEAIEARLVRRIFEMAAAGDSASAICRELNGQGLRTRAGKPWSIRSVLWLLQNRLYVGEAVYGRTRLLPPAPGARAKARRVRRAVPVVHTATSAAPALVAPDLFEQAGASLARHRTTRQSAGARGVSSPHLLVGLARCPCGAGLVVKQHRGSVSYFCPAVRQGRCGGAPGHIRRELADGDVLARFVAYLGPDPPGADRIREAAEHLTQRATEAAGEREALERSLNRLAHQDERLLRATAAGEAAFEDLHDVRESIRRERIGLQTRLNAIEAQATDCDGRCRRIQERLLALGAPDRLALLSRPVLRTLMRESLEGPIILYKRKGTQTVELLTPWSPLRPREALLARLAHALAATADDRP